MTCEAAQEQPWESEELRDSPSGTQSPSCPFLGAEGTIYHQPLPAAALSHACGSSAVPARGRGKHLEELHPQRCTPGHR